MKNAAAAANSAIAGVCRTCMHRLPTKKQGREEEEEDGRLSGNGLGLARLHFSLVQRPSAGQ